MNAEYLPPETAEGRTLALERKVKELEAKVNLLEAVLREVWNALGR